ncbi:MAG: anti-sigma factor antagonist [Planctomycetota bacterium]|jgi:anti-anti-sigma factor|nr:MAG: anti-sigma factor antagonist [Planctomycetota bacterium]
MGIENVGEGLIVVTLPPEPNVSNELKNINERVSNRNDCDVIVDFSNVEIVTSFSISNLMILRNMLRDQGHQLILCKVSVPTKCIFTVAGLDAIFEFAEDREAALTAMQHTG